MKQVRSIHVRLAAWYLLCESVPKGAVLIDERGK
jgi:hypothetical protein